MNLQELPLVVGIFSMSLPVIATYLRGRSRVLAITTMIAALAAAVNLLAVGI